MEAKYDISVIVTTWNRPQFLADALRSLESQDYSGKMQVIVCDDGSNDGTADVLEKFKNSYADFKTIFENPTQDERMKGSRLPIMINKALKIVEGRYISYLPDDDVYKPERNRMMIEFLDRKPDVYFAYHFMKLILISPDKAVVGEAVDLCDRWDEPMRYWEENIYNRIDHTSIVNRNLGKENVSWDENPVYKRCADWGFILKVLKKELKVGCVEKYLAVGRKIQGMSLNRDGDQMIANMMEKTAQGMTVG